MVQHFSRSKSERLFLSKRIGQLVKCIEDHGDRFLNEFNEFIQKPVPMIPAVNPRGYAGDP